MENWERWVKAVIKAVRMPISDSQFLPHLFHVIENDRARISDLGEILTRPHLKLSEQLETSGIQDGATARARLRVCELVKLLINQEGMLDLGAVDHALGTLQRHLYSLGPDRHPDTQRQSHLYRCLQSLCADEGLQRNLESLEVPTGNLYVQELIRESLQLSSDFIVDRVATRRAVLSAWLTYLRQNVGSCFATAPAIMVQAEQPRQFLADMQQLLSTGRLKRTFGGIEYVVPLCKSWGQGDLLRPVSLAAIKHVAHSPGLQAAFDAAGLLEPRASTTHRLKKTMNILRKIQPRLHSRITTSDEIIQQALMNELQLSMKELTDYESRAHIPVPTTLIMAPGVGGLSGKVEKYKKKLEQARFAFKGVTDHPLLKAWEFTIASFSDVKADFSRWNLYASLGIDPAQEDGIGDAIQTSLQERLDEVNREIEGLNARYEIAYAGVQMFESRIRGGTEENERWIRSEYNQKIGELNTIDQERRQVSLRGQHLAHLFRDLVDLYARLFPDYFQEVYDPDMHDVSGNPYDDSPAGFRLLYKHGRANTALWTLIYTPDEWIQSLSDFFVATEGALLATHDIAHLEKEVSDLVTEIITRIRANEFIVSAFDRAAERHRTIPTVDPLQNLEQIGKKPWAYVSGGTMTTLTSAYFAREDPPTLSDRIPESPFDLLVFFLDSLKALPALDTDPYLQDPMQSMLIQSPTHGFLLKPGFEPFRQGWLDRGNSASWIRHHLMRPAQGVIESIHLDEPMMRSILATLALDLPRDLRPSLLAPFNRLPSRRSTVREFRRLVVDTLRYVPWIQRTGGAILPPSRLDSVLFQLLPFTQPQMLRSTTVKLLKELFHHDPDMAERAISAFDLAARKVGPEDPVSSHGLQRILQSCAILASGQTSAGTDIPWQIRVLMRHHGLALSAPMLIADTNWPREFFAFLVNPGTGDLDFWRVDYLGLTGAPMAEWAQWLDGSHTIPWSLYIKPSEYTA